MLCISSGLFLLMDIKWGTASQRREAKTQGAHGFIKDTITTSDDAILHNRVMGGEGRTMTQQSTSVSNTFPLLWASNIWLRAGLCRAGWLLAACKAVSRTGSQYGWIKEFLDIQFCCKQTTTRYPVPRSAVREFAAVHGFSKMSHFKVAGFSFLLLHFLCFLWR